MLNHHSIAIGSPASSQLALFNLDCPDGVVKKAKAGDLDTALSVVEVGILSNELDTLQFFTAIGLHMEVATSNFTKESLTNIVKPAGGSI